MSLVEILQDPNTRWILFGTMLLGLASGVVGTFSYLRKESLMGDVLAHAALPGVAFAFIITGDKSLFSFIIGATVAGLLSVYLIRFIVKNSRIKQDGALGIVLSWFFGIGIVLMTYIQRGGNSNQSGLDKFLFGQAAALVQSDVIIISMIATLVLLVCYVLFGQFKLLAFDEQFAKGLGLKTSVLHSIFMLLTVITIVIGIQAVGVVLMASMLITPAVTARYWTDRLGVMTILSGVFGLVCGAVGAIISASVSGIPTGPVIVLTASALFFLSVLFSPTRGVLAKVWKHQQAKRAFLQTPEPQPMMFRNVGEQHEQ